MTQNWLPRDLFIYVAITLRVMSRSLNHVLLPHELSEHSARHAERDGYVAVPPYFLRSHSVDCCDRRDCNGRGIVSADSA